MDEQFKNAGDLLYHKYKTCLKQHYTPYQVGLQLIQQLNGNDLSTIQVSDRDILTYIYYTFLNIEAIDYSTQYFHSYFDVFNMNKEECNLLESFATKQRQRAITKNPSKKKIVNYKHPTLDPYAKPLNIGKFLFSQFNFIYPGKDAIYNHGLDFILKMLFRGKDKLVIDSVNTELDRIEFVMKVFLNEIPISLDDSEIFGKAFKLDPNQFHLFELALITNETQRFLYGGNNE